MKEARNAKGYYLTEIGEGKTRQLFVFFKTPQAVTSTDKHHFGKDELALLRILIMRSEYLDKIIPCMETKNAVSILTEAVIELNKLALRVSGKKILGFGVKERIDGHIYAITTPHDKDRFITFICRSGGAITYEEEWPGVQSQEVMRMLIARFRNLGRHLGRNQVDIIIYFLGIALCEYEMRAQRRKAEKVNRLADPHQEGLRYKPWHHNDLTPEDIADMVVGPDGHVIIKPN